MMPTTTEPLQPPAAAAPSREGLLPNSRRLAAVLTAVLLTLALGGCDSSSSPAAPSGPPTPATAPFTLERGNVLRIEFTVNPAAWARIGAPDRILVLPGGGASSGAGEGCMSVEVYDGSRRIGSNAQMICGPIQLGPAPLTNDPSQVQVDFAPIIAGTIQGRIDLRLTATRTQSDALYTLSLSRSDPARPGFSTGILGGITITSQSILR